MGVVGACGVCQAAASKTCGGCGCVHYCGKEHQRQHWPKHRAQCRPYKVASSPEAGKYLVASRNLEAGQTLFEEAPFAVGPRRASHPVCLGCHGAIKGEDFPRCGGCSWPLCSALCASSPLHSRECPLLASDAEGLAARGEAPPYDAVLLLRCLLLRSLDPPAWETLLDMAHHTEERRPLLLHRREAEHLSPVRYLTEVLGVDCGEDLLLRVEGAVATNAVEIGGEAGLSAMYPTVRLLNSSCRPSVELLCGAGAVMGVRASVALRAGEPLCFSYTGTMLPLWERRDSLASCYHFRCGCPRCDDPTELGTHFSSPRCPSCGGSSYLLPSGGPDWSCLRCGRQKPDSEVREEVRQWIERKKTDDDALGCPRKQAEAMLEEAATQFHPRHYVWMRAAQAALRRLHGDVSREGLQLRCRIWRGLLVLHDAFEPGVTRRRGMTLLETGRLMLEASQKEYEEGSPFLPEFISRLETARGYLKEASKILGLEPPRTKLAAMAVKADEKRLETERFLQEVRCVGLRAE